MKNQRKIKLRIWSNPTKSWLGPGSGCSKHEFIQYKSGGFSVFGVNEECVVIQQFTGLCDKNGVEIYEGDIITSSCHAGSWPSEVEFSGKNFFYGWRPYRGELELLPYSRFVTVIGNIFDNPKLLKT